MAAIPTILKGDDSGSITLTIATGRIYTGATLVIAYQGVTRSFTNLTPGQTIAFSFTHDETSAFELKTAPILMRLIGQYGGEETVENAEARIKVTDCMAEVNAGGSFIVNPGGGALDPTKVPITDVGDMAAKYTMADLQAKVNQIIHVLAQRSLLSVAIALLGGIAFGDIAVQSARLDSLYNDATVVTNVTGGSGIDTNAVKSLVSSPDLVNTGAVVVAESYADAGLAEKVGTDTFTTSTNALTVAITNKADKSELAGYLPKTGGAMSDEVTMSSSEYGKGFVARNGTDTDYYTRFRYWGFDCVGNGNTYAISLPYNTGTLALTSDIPSTYPWASVTGKPTTLSGYGIQDDADGRYMQKTGGEMAGNLDIGNYRLETNGWISFWKLSASTYDGIIDLNNLTLYGWNDTGKKRWKMFWYDSENEYHTDDIAVVSDIPTSWDWDDISNKPNLVEYSSSSYDTAEKILTAAENTAGTKDEALFTSADYLTITNGTTTAATKSYVTSQNNTTRAIVETWENFLDGSNVVFSITNYISGSYNLDTAKLRIMEMTNGVYREVFNSRNEILLHLNNFKTNDFAVATNTVISGVIAAISDKADKDWGKYTSAGGEAPSNTVYMTAPSTVFAGGLEYERVAVGEGTIGVLTTKGAPVYTTGDEGTFKFQDDGGTNYFGFAKTDSYTLGCDTDGINVNDHLVTLTYNVTMSGVPCIWYKSDISTTGGWEQLNTPDGNPVAGASHLVSWEATPAAGTEVCYINCPEAAGFFRATIEVAGSAKFMTNMPADLGGGILCTNTATGAIGTIRPVYNGSTVTWTWSGL